MRETNKIISIDRTYKEDVVLNKEEIAKYIVDKRNQTITVDVRLSGDETSIVETETYRFFSNNFINDPNEDDLWLLIDNKRSDG
jgi:hypothetical protein